MSVIEGCARCGGRGHGTVCFPDREALAAYCGDQAAVRELHLVAHLVSLPCNDARAEILERLRERQPPELVDRIRRSVWRRLKAVDGAAEQGVLL